jgi:predicted DNA-binding transcriptional regulator AlpA
MIQPVSECQLGGTPKVCKILDCSRASLWRYMQDPTFPRPLRVNPGSSRSRLRFRLTEILNWIENRQALTTAAAEEGTTTLGIHLGR